MRMLRVRRWDEPEERAVAELGPHPVAEALVLLGLVLLAGWIFTRPVTSVQNVDRWPDPVPVEVGR